MTQLGSNRNDIAYDGVPADCALNYISTFGKICVGERFRVLFTIMNTSEKCTLQSIKMVVKLVCKTAKETERVLADEYLQGMMARVQKGFPLEFKVESTC
jgi:hypothetical protein